MVKVRSVNHILDVTFILVPHMLLLHHLLEGVSEVLFVRLSFNHLIKCWIQSHYGVFFRVQLIFQESLGSQIVPVLRVVLQEPSIVVLQV